MKGTRYTIVRRCYCSFTNSERNAEHKTYRDIFERTAERLKIKTWEDWYKYDNKELLQKDPSLIAPLKYFDDSLPRALKTLFSEYKWKPWKFKRLPAKSWRDARFHREYMDDLRNELGLKNWEDLYNIKYHHIINNGGRELLKYYGNSVLNVIRGVYPEYPLKVWRFHLPAGHWKDPKNQKSFFDEVGKEIGIKHWEEWYNVKTSTLQEYGITLVSDYFGGSVSKALMHLYPEYDWKIWKFNSVPNGFWQNVKNQRLFFEDLAKKFNIKTHQDWLQVRHADIVDHGGRGLMKLFDESPLRALASAYPGS